jgi:hypothetical protein
MPAHNKIKKMQKNAHGSKRGSIKPTSHKHITASADQNEEPPLTQASAAEFRNHVAQLNKQDRFAIIVAVSHSDLIIIEEFSRRINKKPERHAILISLETFEELGRASRVLPDHLSVTLHLLGHGAVGQIAGMHADHVAEKILPFLSNNRTDRIHIKIVSCNSGDRIYEPSIQRPDILARVQTARLTISLAQEVSTILKIKNLQPPIFGYRGAHFENYLNNHYRSCTAFEKNDKRRANARRVCFIAGELIEGPTDPDARQQPSGTWITTPAGEKGPITFDLGY